MKFMIIFVAFASVHCRPQTLENEESISEDIKVTVIPFYGGGKGQSLQITETPDGKVTTTIIKTPEKPVTHYEESTTAAEVENPPLPTKHDVTTGLQDEYVARNLNESGNNEDGQIEQESREGLSAWFSRKKQNKEKKDKKDEKKKKEDEDKKKKEEEDKKKEEEEKKKEEEEKNKEEEKEKEEIKEEDIDDDTVAINLPPEDASIAEARPVGLSIAGEGGVAASKPIGTAVVGPGGLAISRPVGTAIAGVPPDQVPTFGGKKAEKGNYIGKLISRYHQD